jgi:hypothetical protein
MGSVGSLLPLLLVAVLAFLIGHYVNHDLPVLRQLLSK